MTRKWVSDARKQLRAWTWFEKFRDKSDFMGIFSKNIESVKYRRRKNRVSLKNRYGKLQKRNCFKIELAVVVHFFLVGISVGSPCRTPCITKRIHFSRPRARNFTVFLVKENHFKSESKNDRLFVDFWVISHHHHHHHQKGPLTEGISIK